MILNIQVTKEHIDNGIVNDGHSCAVALAIIDTLKKRGLVGRVFVQANCFDIFGPRYSTNPYTLIDEVPLPEVVQEFISDFDGLLPVEPFEFLIDIESL